MKSTTLGSAMQRLRDCYEIGIEINATLELGAGGKQARDGQVKKACKAVSRKWRRKVGYELARKMVSFSRRYSEKQLMALLDQCEQYDYAPEFGLIIRLLPLKVQLRNKLQLMAIKGEWSKQRLERELLKHKPKKQLLDAKRRGRKPKAAASKEALFGEATADAVKWARVLDLLKAKDNPVWGSMSSRQRSDVESLAKLLQRMSRQSR